MNLKEQLYICTLARCQTMTKAAEELFLTVPALSMFLSSLEKTLGAKLFRRTGKTLQPTPVGERYLYYAEQMLRLKEDFDRELTAEIGMQKQTVRIGIQTRRAISAIPWMLPRFKEKLPNLHVIFRDGEYYSLMKLYEQHQVDYLFYTMDEEVPDAEYVLLEEEPILVALPKDHRCNCLAKQDPQLDYPYLNLEALKGETLILPLQAQSLRLKIDRLLKMAGFSSADVNMLEIQNFAAIIKTAAEGLGIGFIRAGYLEDLLPSERICYYYLGQKPAASPLVLLYAKGKKKAIYHEQLVQIFREYLSSR